MTPDEPYDPVYHDGNGLDSYGGTVSRAALLLKFNGAAVGITTLDMLPDGRAIMRGVGVRKGDRGKGHGAALGRLVEDYARVHGSTKLVVNADPAKCGYYEKLGFSNEVWSESEFEPWRSGRATPPAPVQMAKRLT